MVVALVADLIFQSKISGVAAHLGLDVRVERTVAAARAAAMGATGLLVDLTVDELGTIELVQDVRRASGTLPIVGFFPHVQAELGRRARTAGADRVLPRSKFAEDLPDLLRELSVPRPSPSGSSATKPEPAADGGA